MRHRLSVIAAAAVLALPASAHAIPSDVIKDCADDGALSGDYSNAELRRALEDLPTDLDEYSDCREVIGAAVTAPPGDRGGASGDDGAGGAVAAEARRQAEAQDTAALERITRSGERPKVSVGGTTIEPGSSGLFELSTASSDVPVPLLLALCAIGLLVAAGTLYGLRGRLPALARLPALPEPLRRAGRPRFRR